MKKNTRLFLLIAVLLAWGNAAIAQNTDCFGISKLASEGVFTDGYIYKFTTVGTDVTVTFELLDNKSGLVVFIRTYNPDFTEVEATNVSGKKFTKTFPGQTLGASFKVACKFAYTGTLATTKTFTYIVGNSCSETPPDTELPTLFTATKGTVSYHGVELLLNATDNSGTVIYEITNGSTKYLTTGTSGVQKSYTINGLTASTSYTFSVVAKDISANVAGNSPVLVNATTDINTSTECAGSYADAQQGEFADGYNYTFSTLGTDVTVTFELLDNKNSVEAFMWTYNPNFSEVAATSIGAKKFSKTFSGQALDAKFKVACKFAYTGGMAVTKILTYTVGNTCGGGSTDTEIPTAFTATKGAVTGNSVELLLNATDNSGAVIYAITYGTTTLTTSGTSAVQTSYIVTGLAPTTAYSFSVVAKDASGNLAANSPIVVTATTGTFTPELATIDYETVGQNWTWTVFGNGTNSLNTHSITANPNSSGINTSATCAKYIVNSDGAPWAGVESKHGTDLGSFTFNANNSFIKIMVYKAVISPVGIKFADPSGWAQPEIKVSNTKINEWEELTFNFSSRIGDRSCDQIIIFPDYPSARTAGSTNYWDNISFSGTTGVKDNKMAENITMYPNPVQDKLVIKSEQEINQVIISNLLGQNIKTVVVNNREAEIDLSQVSSGNYFISFKLADGQLATQKLIKK